MKRAVAEQPCDCDGFQPDSAATAHEMNRTWIAIRGLDNSINQRVPYRDLVVLFLRPLENRCVALRRDQIFPINDRLAGDEIRRLRPRIEKNVIIPANPLEA